MFKHKSILLTLLILFITSISHASLIEIDQRSGFSLDFIQDQIPVLSPNPNGEFSITIDGISTFAFCVELDAQPGDGTAFLRDPSQYTINGNSAGFEAAWLMDTYSTGLGFDFNTIIPPTSFTGTLYTYPFNPSSTAGTITEDLSGVSLDNEIADVALQIAIWETIYDYGSSGDFFKNFIRNISGNESLEILDNSGKRFMAWALADIYTRNIPNDLSEDDFSGKYKFYVAEFEGNQNLLVAKPIPEPATMILFGLGLLGISAMGRKRS